MPPISAGLLAVLAEAVAGYPNEGVRWFVATYATGPDGSYNLWPPYDNEADAVEQMTFLNSMPPGGYGVFGPYDTTLAFTLNPQQQTVENVSVTPGSSPAFDLGGATKYDAMFSSVAAVLKFAVPYYTSVYSTRFADRAVAAFLASDLALMVHLPWSEYGIISTSGGETGPGHQNVVEGERAGEGGGHDRSAPTAEGGPGSGEKRWIPVVFHRHPDGSYHPDPIYPDKRDLRA